MHPSTRLPIAMVSLVLLAPLLALPLASPAASASTITLDRFVGGGTSVQVTFGPRPWNDSAAIELPYGSRVSSATVTAQGFPGPSIVYTPFDLSGGSVGADRWAMEKGGHGLYPPSLDPYTAAWAHIDGTGLAGIAADDGSYWETQTYEIDYTPPWERDLQVYQFHPHVPGSPGLEVVWNGHGRCSANESNEYQAELWVYDHDSSAWRNMTGYMSNAAGDVWLNATVEAGTGLWAANGSLAVAIVSPPSLAVDSWPVARADNGHLFTDYIGLRVRDFGADEWASSANLTVGGSPFVLSTGPMTGTVVLGAAQGLAAAIQAVIDAHAVIGGDLTVPLNLSVAGITMAGVELSGLSVEYDPPVNEPPVWTGPASADVQEDSEWTDVLLLEGAFTDDLNPDDLAYGIVSISDGTGLFAFIGLNVNGTHSLSVRPAPDFFGEVLVKVSATDRFGAATASPAITVRVAQVPDGPVLADPGALQATEEVPFDHTMGATDADLPDDALAFSDTSTLLDVDPSTGRIEWTPGQDQVGTHAFYVTVTDRFGLTSTVAVRIDVANVDDAPVITSPLAVEARQDQPFSYAIVAEDPDVPFGDVLSYFAFSGDVDVQVNMATGTVAFTPTNGDVGLVTVLLRVQDRAGLRDDEILNVTVVNVNDPPALEPVGDRTYEQGSAVSVGLRFSDPDLAVAGAGERLVLGSDGPAWLAPDAAGWINFTADQSRVGVYIVDYTVTDTSGLTAAIRVRWTVVDINDPPVISTDVPGVVDAVEDETFTLLLSAMDLDGDALAWEDDTSLFAVEPSTGFIAFTPRQKDVGTHHVTITVSDGNGGAASRSFDLVVANVNDAPVVRSVAPANGTSYPGGTSIPFLATATDEDGDPLTYIWKEGTTELGRGAAFSTRYLSSGRHTLTLSVTDGNATTDVMLQVDVTAKARKAPGPTMPAAVAALAAVAAMALGPRGRRRGGA